MNKIAVLYKMVVLANDLDDMGMSKEADEMDSVMEKVAGHLGEVPGELSGGGFAGITIGN